MPAYEKRFSNNKRIALRLIAEFTGNVDTPSNSSEWYWRVEIDEVVPPSVAYNVNRPPDPRAPWWYCDLGGRRVGEGFFIYRFWQSSGAIVLGEGYTWLTHGTDGTLGVSASAGAKGIPLGSVQINSVDSETLEAPRILRGPRIQYGGSFRNSILYVKHEGQWRQAIPYVKYGGQWHLAGA